MADVSIPTLIIFIASVVVAAGVSGVLISTVTDISGALDDRGTKLADSIQTEVDIVSPNSGEVYHDGNVTVYVKNTGSRTLTAAPERVDVLFDAQYQPGVAFESFDGDANWYPGEVVELTIPVSNLSEGDHRITLIVDGAKEEYQFHL